MAVLLLVLAIAGLVGLTWGNLRYARENPGGNDFLVHWMGTRTFLVEGISPYSDVTSIRIQTAVYGRPAREGEHELRFAYPLYSIVLFFPFALIKDFEVARAIYMTVLEVSLIALAWLSLRVGRWKPGVLRIGLFVIFGLIWYHGVRPIINGNAIILVALMLTAAFLAMRHRSDEMAGVLLAFCTIKPQVAIIPGIFMLVWTIAHGRWKLLLWFVGTLGLLSGAAALLLPDWILQNLREIMRYPGYNPPGTPGQAMAVWIPAMGVKIGQGISILVGVVLLIEWILSIRRHENGISWAFCLTLVLSQWSGIQNDPGNYVVLLPVLPMIFRAWEDRWRRVGRVLTIVSLLGLLVGIWWVFVGTLEITYQPVQSPVMIFVLPGILLVLLYWTRWWAIQPPRVWGDVLAELDQPRGR
jgi:hypothetical protein